MPAPRQDVKRHVEEILIERGYKKQSSLACPHCQKAFDVKINLTNHIRRVHQGRKDYVCPHCQKWFAQKGHLTTHIRTVHEGRKDYVCPHCTLGWVAVGAI